MDESSTKVPYLRERLLYAANSIYLAPETAWNLLKKILKEFMFMFMCALFGFGVI